MFIPWRPSPIACQTVFALAVLVTSVQVAAFLLSGLYSPAHHLVLLSCFTAILFPLLLLVFQIKRKSRLNIMLAMFLLFPVLAIGDMYVNLGLPFGYYGRLNIVRSYVASLPGVELFEAVPGGDGSFRLERIHLTVGFTNPFTRQDEWSSGLRQDVSFGDGSLWANYREIEAWYAGMMGFHWRRPLDWLSWYNGLLKPSWTPSPSTIGLIWRILYPIIILTFGFVFVQAVRGKVGRRVALPFAVNIVANLLFMPLFAGLRYLPLTAVDILVVLGTIIWMVIAVWPHYRWVAIAQLPYLVWVSIAAVLQLSITWMNR